jgi:hypothetical protein
MIVNILPADVIPSTLADDGRRLQSLGIPADLAPHVTEYVYRLNEAQARNLRNTAENLWQRVIDAGTLAAYSYFDVDPGATSAGKFLRIVTMRPSRDNSTAVYVPDSVHAFLVKSTGDLVKPAGWAGPAKSTSKDPAKRGRLLSHYTLADEGSRATLLARLAADDYAPHGGYLYSR